MHFYNRHMIYIDIISIYEVFFWEREHLVASELKDPICHSNECQIGSFSSEATT